MNNLSEKLVEKKSRPEKILQFGEGNFLRAFASWMINELNKKELFDGSIVVVQPIEQGLVEKLNNQDCLYTLLSRGILNGETINKKEVIQSISRGINPYKNWNDLIECAESSDLRFVISNTTEAGIAYSAEDYTPGKTQITFPAKVTACLKARFEKFAGAADKGLVFIPCELISANGDNLKRFVLQYANDWNLGDDFIKWIEKNNYFCNTLVDRIVPGYPREEADSLCKELGYKDNLLDAGEPFHLWVIEGPDFLKNELKFQEAGLQVIFTNDINPYRTRKVRVLNGAHTACVLGAYLSGMETVREMTEDVVYGKFLRNTMFEEILPTLDLPDEEKKEYANAILERFSNPFIKHALLSISLNSVSKWKVRVLPTLLDYTKTKGEFPQRLGFSLAALIRFYQCEIIDGKAIGSIRAKEYEVNDDKEILEYFEDIWKAPSTDIIAEEVLSNTYFWDEDLTEIDGFKDFISENLQKFNRGFLFKEVTKSFI